MKRKTKPPPEPTVLDRSFIDDDRPPWWRDATYHETGGDRTIQPTLFGRRARL